MSDEEYEGQTSKQNSTKLLSLSDLIPQTSNVIIAAAETSENILATNNPVEKQKRTPSGNTIFNSLSEIKKVFASNPSPKTSKNKGDSQERRRKSSCLENDPLSEEPLKCECTKHTTHSVLNQAISRQHLTLTPKQTDRHDKSVNKLKTKRKYHTDDKPAFDLYNYLKSDNQVNSNSITEKDEEAEMNTSEEASTPAKKYKTGSPMDSLNQSLQSQACAESLEKLNQAMEVAVEEEVAVISVKAVIEMFEKVSEEISKIKASPNKVKTENIIKQVEKEIQPAFSQYEKRS